MRFFTLITVYYLHDWLWKLVVLPCLAWKFVKSTTLVTGGAITGAMQDASGINEKQLEILSSFNSADWCKNNPSNDSLDDGSLVVDPATEHIILLWLRGLPCTLHLICTIYFALNNFRAVSSCNISSGPQGSVVGASNVNNFFCCCYVSAFIL